MGVGGGGAVWIAIRAFVAQVGRLVLSFDDKDMSMSPVQSSNCEFSGRARILVCLTTVLESRRREH